MTNGHFRARLSPETLADLQVITAWLTDHQADRGPIGRGQRPKPTASDAVRYAIRRVADHVRRRANEEDLA